jgi:hypothetical protein
LKIKIRPRLFNGKPNDFLRPKIIFGRASKRSEYQALRFLVVIFLSRITKLDSSIMVLK